MSVLNGGHRVLLMRGLGVCWCEADDVGVVDQDVDLSTKAAQLAGQGNGGSFLAELLHDGEAATNKDKAIGTGRRSSWSRCLR
ncbi:hypothetical protein Ate01nite_38360 [Actinoplanes teichomyceticus]|nr:hypothetical protein Ate01nite_38360 [Actinoplanes teichomyceticus]